MLYYAVLCLYGYYPIALIDDDCPNDTLPSLILLQVQDEITFTLFDEIIEDDGDRGGFYEGESSERVERRYIGSFTIPFSTVFKEGRIEGASCDMMRKCVFSLFFSSVSRVNWVWDKWDIKYFLYSS